MPFARSGKLSCDERGEMILVMQPPGTNTTIARAGWRLGNNKGKEKKGEQQRDIGFGNAAVGGKPNHVVMIFVIGGVQMRRVLLNY